MPRVRRFRPARCGRRRLYRRSKRSNRITTVPSGLNPVAPRYICKMKYSEYITTDATGQYVMNLNSIFDPNRTGVGHQPYGFDTMANLYNRYRVISCGWRIQRAMLDGGNPLMIGAIPSNDDSILWTDFSELRENPRGKYIMQNAGAGVVTLKGKSYLPALVGRTKAQYMADDHYQSIVTTNPIERCLFYILSYNANDVFAPGTGLQVLLEYTVEFFDIKRQVRSWAARFARRRPPPRELSLDHGKKKKMKCLARRSQGSRPALYPEATYSLRFIGIKEYWGV